MYCITTYFVHMYNTVKTPAFYVVQKIYVCMYIRLVGIINAENPPLPPDRFLGHASHIPSPFFLLFVYFFYYYYFFKFFYCSFPFSFHIGNLIIHSNNK